MERAIELYAAIQFVVIGLSHVLQPHAWVDFFIALRERGRAENRRGPTKLTPALRRLVNSVRTELAHFHEP